jgi:hypothetical protein
MLKPVFDIFDKLFLDFSWRRLASLCVFLIVVVSGLAVFESLTSHFQLKKIDKQVKILTQLNDISVDKGADEIYHKAKSALLEDLNETTESHISFPAFSPRATQALIWFFPWALFGLIYIPDIRRGDSDGWTAVIGVLVLGFLAAIIGYFLPLTWHAGLRYGVILPLFVVILIAGVSKLGDS